MESLKEMLKEYEISLKDNLFITGSEPSYEDAQFFKLLLESHYKPQKKEYPSVWSWYSLMILFEDEVITEWLKKGPKENKKEHKNENKKENKKENKNEKKKENKNEKKNKEKKVHKNMEPYICDEPDNFEEKPEYKDKIVEDIKKHKDEKSNVFLEIKPDNEEQDLNILAKKIMKDIKRNGLKWSEKYEIKDIGFNLKKLIMGMNVEMDTSVQDIIDQLETWEEEIQSVDFALFCQC